MSVSSKNSHQELLKTLQNRVEEKLTTILNHQSNAFPKLQQAMAYSVLGGGKRIRALFVYCTGLCFNTDLTLLDNAACAVELIHAYSLIHDDLPAMDDAPLRRGKPSCHLAFDEATAILAGDALLPLAFELLAEQNHPQSSAIISVLAKAIGPNGMVLGQMLDLFLPVDSIDAKQIEWLHHKKTGELFAASVIIGALNANCQNDVILSALNEYAFLSGLAFQIHDDILDIEIPTEQLGKVQGKDSQFNKPTYPIIVGMDKAKAEVKLLFNKAKSKLISLDINTESLMTMVDFLEQRVY